MNYDKIKSDFDACDNDKERWECVLKHKEHVVISLDNDYTEVYANDYDGWSCTFGDFIGNGRGLDAMFEAFGINAEPV